LLETTTAEPAFAFAIVRLAREEVAAQTMAKDLVGTWTLVSVTLEQDGKKSDLFEL